MAEEVLDLIAHYGREISVAFGQGRSMKVIDWNREDLFVETMVILHQQSDWAISAENGEVGIETVCEARVLFLSPLEN